MIGDQTKGLAHASVPPYRQSRSQGLESQDIVSPQKYVPQRYVSQTKSFVGGLFCSFKLDIAIFTAVGAVIFAVS